MSLWSLLKRLGADSAHRIHYVCGFLVIVLLILVLLHLSVAVVLFLFLLCVVYSALLQRFCNVTLDCTVLFFCVFCFLFSITWSFMCFAYEWVRKDEHHWKLIPKQWTNLLWHTQNKKQQWEKKMYSIHTLWRTKIKEWNLSIYIHILYVYTSKL